MELTTYNDQQLSAFGAAAAALQGDMKPILKFDKGDWLLGQDKDDVPSGTQFGLNMMDAKWGWILWRDKQVDDRRMHLVSSGKHPDARGELGHDDKGLWERDKDGKPIDPWSKTIEIPARALSGDKVECILSGSSKGWEGCCKKLFDAFGKGMRENVGKVPVVALGVSSYEHRTYGRVKVPVLEIVGWKAPDDLEAEPVAAKPKTKF